MSDALYGAEPNIEMAQVTFIVTVELPINRDQEDSFSEILEDAKFVIEDGIHEIAGSVLEIEVK